MELNKLFYFSLLLLTYFFSGYIFERHETVIIFFLFFSCFAITFLVSKKLSINEILFFGISFRLVLFFAYPWLSEDFYRFIWDGFLIGENINPYQYTPYELMNYGGIIETKNIFEELYFKMSTLNSLNYSPYPPINQFLFFLSTSFKKDIFFSLISMRSLIILSDILNFFVGRGILKKFKLKEEKILWYFLNPLVIIELTGNLHFEGFMLTFFGFGILLFLENKKLFALFPLAFSVGTKLITLIIIPFILNQKKINENLKMMIPFSVLLFFIFFFPIGNHNLPNFYNTIKLWFSTLEFNGSVYYIIRYLGYKIKGYNIIKSVGLVTPLITTITVLYLIFNKKKETKVTLEDMFLLLTFFYLISMVVHPWYIITILYLGLFTKYNFQIIWSALIFLTYSAYQNSEVDENFYLIGLEYIIVFGFFIYEFFGRERIKTFLKKKFLL